VRNSDQGFTTQRYEKESFKNQFLETFNGFFDGVFTMKMVAESKGIDRANICRYVANLRKSNLIFYVKKDRCRITNCLAGYYTTNEQFKPITNQLKLF
jgi:hypothetical protein